MNDPDAFKAALASGELLTANQAAKHIGVSHSTFNYHLRLGHIPSLPIPASRTYFITRADAERFARRLRMWRDHNDDFDWLLDETSNDPALETSEPVAASA